MQVQAPASDERLVRAIGLGSAILFVVESLAGLGLLALGLPAYWYWKKPEPQT